MDTTHQFVGFNSVTERNQALRQARAVLKEHGKSYYFSSCLFPKKTQQATWAVYAFVRLPDQIVDDSPQSNSADLERVSQQLRAYRVQWRAAYAGAMDADPILRLAAQTWHEYHIPFAYSESFLDAMEQDLVQSSYASYQDLQGYMYGSASVIGLMMSHIIGFSDASALPLASKLGEAMQMTNFLRDIEEDWTERGRVYMPQDEMAKFGLSSEDIAVRNFSPAFQEFMKGQAARVEMLYDEANRGIPLLNPQGRLAVAAASTLYRAVLGRLEAQQWNPFQGRAATSLAQKVCLLGRARNLSRQAVS